MANKKDGKSEIKVWTTEGVGSTEEEEWTLLVDEEVELSKEGFTGIDLGTEITIPAGGEQAFYIHSKQVGIKYYEGGLRDGEEASSITDGNVEVSVMVATDEPKPFDGQLDELGVYTGGIGYYMSASQVSLELSFDFLMYIIYNILSFYLTHLLSYFSYRTNPRRTNRVRVKEKMMSPPTEKIPRMKRRMTTRRRMVLLVRGGKMCDREGSAEKEG